MARVLVVDDSDVIARLLHDLLAHHGHEVTDCSNRPKDLLDLNGELWDDVDVLVTDLRMPEVSGLELLAHATAYYPHVYRIALTGWDDPTTHEVVMDVADLLLRKPDHVLDLPDLIENRPTT